MKLRIHGGSIRLRLKQSEVKDLAEGREVVEFCPTLPVALTYALRPDPSISALAAHSEGGRLTVLVPTPWLLNWETDDRVGLEGEAGGVQLLIEKDWKCSSPSFPQDNEDCFENPNECAG